jgi:hypothetical protein
VKLIRELREEIDKLRSMVSQNDPVTARKLAVKEAQVTHFINPVLGQKVFGQFSIPVYWIR